MGRWGMLQSPDDVCAVAGQWQPAPEHTARAVPETGGCGQTLRVRSHVRGSAVRRRQFHWPLRETALLELLAAAARAGFVAADLLLLRAGPLKQIGKFAWLAHGLRQRVHRVALFPREIQIQPEAQRLIAGSHADPEPGLGVLGVLPGVTVSLQTWSGDFNRVVAAMNREPGIAAAKAYGQIMVLAITDALFGDLLMPALTSTTVSSPRVRRVKPRSMVAGSGLVSIALTTRPKAVAASRYSERSSELTEAR